ncbi:putative transcription factor NAM family [Rosa chinensis]|uniref:Putative transcription factor NAM family n=1 Tax=Rosa chinensis TaxID=74649 RepID=A0A2P6PGY9_ROSCH|nr:putative transcription factor NAM family [Rosa chinensis]
MDRCFPVGFRFHPTDEELIGHYLHLKNNPNSATPSLVLPEFDLYGEAEPWIIWDAYGGPNLKQQDLFFFTLLKKKANPRGGHASTRHSRRVGSSGTWSQGEPSRPIFGEKNQETPIGRKTKLRYENKLVPEQHGCWIMEEYTSVDDQSSCPAAHDHYVICRLRENKTGQRRKSQDDDDHHPKPRKKPKSLTVADPQPAFTTNEARKTVSLNQSPNPEQQFENELIISEGEAQSSISNCIGMPEDIDWLDLALEDIDWLDLALEEVQGDRLSPALAEQQSLTFQLC